MLEFSVKMWAFSLRLQAVSDSAIAYEHKYKNNYSTKVITTLYTHDVQKSISEPCSRRPHPDTLHTEHRISATYWLLGLLNAVYSTLCVLFIRIKPDIFHLWQRAIKVLLYGSASITEL